MAPTQGRRPVARESLEYRMSDRRRALFLNFYGPTLKNLVISKAIVRVLHSYGKVTTHILGAALQWSVLHT